MIDESKSFSKRPRNQGCIFGLLLFSGVVLCVAAMYMLRTVHAWHETIDSDRPGGFAGLDLGSLGRGFSIFVACPVVLLCTAVISIVVLIFSKAKSIRTAALFPFLASV